MHFLSNPTMRARRSSPLRFALIALLASAFLSLHVAAHAITSAARLPEPTPVVGGVSPNELYGGAGFLAKRSYEDVTNCDGAGVLTCGGGSQYCYSGVNDYLGCCDKGKTCYARTECVPYSEASTRDCDSNTGGCTLCTNSAAPSCVRLTNAGGQYGLYCDSIATTSSYAATKVANPNMSTGVAIGTPGMTSASQGSSSTGSLPTSSGSNGPLGPSSPTAPAFSKGVLAGVIVAGVCAILIGAFLIWHFCIKKKRASRAAVYAHAPHGSGDIPLSGYADNETKSTAASSTFPSPALKSTKHSSTYWNADSFEHDTPYAPGPEGAELDSTAVVGDRSPLAGSVSSFKGSPRMEQRNSALSTKVSPLIGVDTHGAQEPALLDSAEVKAGSGHQRHQSTGNGAAVQYSPYRPSNGNGLGPGQPAGIQTRHSSAFPSYLTPENALGGGYEADEQRLKEEARRSGEHL